MSDPTFVSYEEFWPAYVRAHTKPSTRAMHALGTGLFLATAVALVTTRRAKFLLAMPLVGYGPAWVSHFFLEGNAPATFTHPLWSLRADFEMTFRMLTGTMASEVARHTAVTEPTVTEPTVTEPTVTIQGEDSAPGYAHAAPDTTVH